MQVYKMSHLVQQLMFELRMKQPKKCYLEVPESTGKAILVDVGGELSRLPFLKKMCKIPQTIVFYLHNSLWIHKSRKNYFIAILYFIFIANASMKVTFW